MSQKNKFIRDSFIIAISIYFAIFILQTGLVNRFINLFAETSWLGVVFAGMFFTSVFTTAPSIALLSQFAETVNPLHLALLGGFGAMIGDYVLFKLVKNHISEDFEYLLTITKLKTRFRFIFKSRLFKFFAPFIGALVLASPLPDEIGVSILSLSKVKESWFLPLAFVLNGAGIFVIGYLSRI